MDRSLRKRLEARFGDAPDRPRPPAPRPDRDPDPPGRRDRGHADLHDEPEFEFEILADLAGVDTGTDMQVVYHLWSRVDARTGCA